MDDRSDDAPRRGGEQLSHEWEASYAATPPWDIGRPQDPFVRLAEAGHLHGSVLDVGWRRSSTSRSPHGSRIVHQP